MSKFIGIILVIVALVCPTVMIVKSTLFGINCGGHMNLAAKANSVALAQKEMEIVVKYLEDHKMTAGYTSILWNSPKEDVEFFYNNMKTSLEELRGIKENSPPLEKSNVLMKLRETLTEQGEKSENIVAPNGISRFPHNAGYGLWLNISIILAAVGVIIFLHADYYGH
jgi:hypothetical protein